MSFRGSLPFFTKSPKSTNAYQYDSRHMRYLAHLSAEEIARRRKYHIKLPDPTLTPNAIQPEKPSRARPGGYGARRRQT